MASEVFLSCSGPIEKGPILKYGASGKTPFTKFAIRYAFQQGREGVTQWFSFIAFRELAEYIATHYRRGKLITILKARPYRETTRNQFGKVFHFPVWVVSEIGEPFSEGHFPNPEAKVTEYTRDDRPVS